MPESYSTRDAYGEILLELGKQKDDIFVVDADLSCSTKTSLFAREFPRRFVNVGCAEQDLMGTAAGLALGGKTVFASSHAVFATYRNFEIIRNIIAHDCLNVKIVTTHSGLTNSVDGYTHHSLEDIALMRVLPNMNIIVPADSVETKKVIGYCCNDKLPYYIRLNRPKTPVLYENGCEFKLGKWDILFEGDDLSLIASGTMVPVAVEVHDKLKAKNLSVEVINASSIKPFDKDVLLKTAKKTGMIVTLEDHSVIGGLGSLVSEYLSSESPVKVHSFGVNDEFSQSGSIDELYAYYGLTSDEIVKKIHGIVEG